MKISRSGKAIGTWLALACVLAGTAAAAADYWPTDGWRPATPEQQGMRSEPLAEMLTEITELEHRIDSVTAVRNGYVVLDAYVHPFQKGMKHIIHSDTKSIVSALVGIAIARGEIDSIARPVLSFFADSAVANVDARKRAMTLAHLLTMTSGLDCRDSYRHRWVGLVAMRKSPDWAQYVLDLPMAQDPGQGFDYCNGASFLLSAILQKATKTRALDYARKHLFAPLGIKDVIWPQTPRGVTIGYGEMWLKPHDMAKFGWLYLNKGAWDGRQIVAQAWVESSTRRHGDATLFDHYGYQWWRDASGYYMAVGFRGQFIFVVPNKNLVAVFTSDLEGRNFFVPRDLLTQYIIPAAASDMALPANQAQQARLAALVKQTTKGPAAGFVWKTPEEGVARDGLFVRRAAPAFQFRLPPGSRKEPLLGSGQVMRMKTLEGFRIGANVAEIPADTSLAQVGPKDFAPLLRGVGRDIRVISNKAIVLGDGTPAYRTEFKWRARAFEITTFVVSAFREGKWVFISAHPWKKSDTASDIVQSLRFQSSN